MGAETFACPCDYAARTGLDPRKCRQVGLADSVLYRTILIATDERGGEPFYLVPCRKGCTPPPAGQLPKRPKDGQP